MDDDWVGLTDATYNRARSIGRATFVECRRRGTRDLWADNGGDGLWASEIGAVAECAAAQALGLPWPLARVPWPADARYKPVDLDYGIEVRLIRGQSFDLRVTPKDPPLCRVLGVIIPPGGERDPYRLAGWITADEGRRIGPKLDPYGNKPFYAVRQSQLRPVSELRAIIAAERDGIVQGAADRPREAAPAAAPARPQPVPAAQLVPVPVPVPVPVRPLQLAGVAARSGAQLVPAAECRPQRLASPQRPPAAPSRPAAAQRQPPLPFDW